MWFDVPYYNPLSIAQVGAAAVGVDEQVIHRHEESTSEIAFGAGRLVRVYTYAATAFDKGLDDSELGVEFQAATRLLTMRVVEVVLHERVCGLLRKHFLLLLHH